LAQNLNGISYELLFGRKRLRRILFISGSIGLGHINRDIEIAKALRDLDPELEISWLAQDPASRVLLEAGEKLLPEASLLAHENEELENLTHGYNANLTKTIMNIRKEWTNNAQLVGDIVRKEQFDLVVGDETYDLLIERVSNKKFQRFPFVIIYDFIGVDSVRWNPIEMIATYVINRMWVKALKANPPIAEQSIFIGEVEDIDNRKFGFLLPNRREIASKNVAFIGYVLQFNPNEYQNKEAVRKQLGYGKEPLIVCSIGGTSVGKELLDLCAKALPNIQKEIPNVRMVLVCGPRLSTDSISPIPGLEIKGYVPELFKHFAAADLCIVTGGGTTTLELISLQKPFLYFPLSSHFEQMVDVANRCQRYHVGEKMDFAKTTPDLLAKTVLANIGKKTSYVTIKTTGAKKAAEHINQILKNPKK
jgi:predicted glycosyltransferase